MAHILVADDDEMLAMVVSELVATKGHHSELALSAAASEQKLKDNIYDLIILDWEFPDGSGISIIEAFRKSGGLTPLLMLTGKSEADERSRGLDAGADDYVNKPYDERELLARVQALLRRPKVYHGNRLEKEGLTMDRQSHQVWLNGKEIHLQPLEYAVLEFFMLHPNTVFSPDLIVKRVWESDRDISPDAVYACIKRLRKKLEIPGRESYFRTIHRVGYEFVIRDNHG